MKASRNLTALNSALVKRVVDEDSKRVRWDFTVPSGYGLLAVALIIYMLDRRFVLLVLFAVVFGSFTPTAAMSLGRTLKIVEAANVGTFVLLGNNLTAVCTFMLVIVCVYRRINGDYMTRVMSCSLIYPFYCTRGLEASLGMLFFYLMTVLFDERFRELEYVLSEKFKDFRGGDLDAEVDVILELGRIIDRLVFKCMGVTTVYKSVVHDVIVSPVVYIKVMVAQSMYGNKKAVKHPRGKDRRRRNVKNMRSLLFYPVVEQQV